MSFVAGFSLAMTCFTASSSRAASMPTSSGFLCCQSNRSGKYSAGWVAGDRLLAVDPARCAPETHPRATNKHVVRNAAVARHIVFLLATADIVPTSRVLLGTSVRSTNPLTMSQESARSPPVQLSEVPRFVPSGSGTLSHGGLQSGMVQTAAGAKRVPVDDDPFLKWGVDGRSKVPARRPSTRIEPASSQKPQTRPGRSSETARSTSRGPLKILY